MPQHPKQFIIQLILLLLVSHQLRMLRHPLLLIITLLVCYWVQFLIYLIIIMHLQLIIIVILNYFIGYSNHPLIIIIALLVCCLMQSLNYLYFQLQQKKLQYLIILNFLLVQYLNQYLFCLCSIIQVPTKFIHQYPFYLLWLKI